MKDYLFTVININGLLVCKGYRATTIEEKVQIDTRNSICVLLVIIKYIKSNPFITVSISYHSVL